MSCGETIKKDTKLDRNLLNCPNNGIMIGADGVTLNLNGHLIDGDGTDFRGCDPNGEVCDTGIVDDGHDRVTVKNGRVRQFAVGVLFGTSTPGVVRHGRVLGITSSGNRFFGFVIASTVRSLVRDSSAIGNLAPDGDGLGLFASRHVRILHNSFRHNAEIGIHMDQSSHNLISGNLFTETGEFAALLITGSNRNQVRGNHSVRDRDGIILGPGNGNVIAGNRITRPGGGRWPRGRHRHRGGARQPRREQRRGRRPSGCAPRSPAATDRRRPDRGAAKSRQGERRGGVPGQPEGRPQPAAATTQRWALETTASTCGATPRG